MRTIMFCLILAPVLTSCSGFLKAGYQFEAAWEAPEQNKE